ncbi:DUF885 domain-containing protein [Mesonia maritima]|uniref:Uncharacterized protein (DUF885 family) n=1 Tax=Mesonia maritima TaxID=1793873 RepID=A0ABU1K7V4_9FLAO|nr:DUF885 domain-containing protein [Mesonia maritima]MDR6301107.1 uncharacterized protein (DUF885 family) [Mesonia maritima]
MQKRILYILLGILIISCKQKPEKTELTPSEINNESEKLSAFFERTFKEDVADSPMFQTQLGQKTDYGKWDDFSNQKYAEDLERSKKRLAYLKDSINQKALPKKQRLSYRLKKQKLEEEVEDYKYRFYDYPINQMNGYHTALAAFLINQHRIDSVSDAKAYIQRLKGMHKAFEEIAQNMQIREKNGILPPKFVFSKVLESSKSLISGKPFDNSNKKNPLFEDFSKKVNKLTISKAEKKALISEAKNVLLSDVKPAYELLIKTLEDQFQRATTDHGVWKFPKGDEFYKNRLNRITTLDLTAEEIHEIGLTDVNRIHEEMKAIMKKVGFKGTLKDFFNFMRTDAQFYYENNEAGKSKYLAESKSIIDRMRENLDKLFLTLPKAEIKVKAVEEFREKSAGKAFYQAPALDGSRPGIFYANLYDMSAMPTYQMEALAYHEGIPGHHMQIAIAQELDSIPEFRKHIFYTAYIEGWGLYSEKIPKEIGFYKDPYSDFGRLSLELWRACRLVVDTGIHSKKWTREKAIEFYKTNTPNAESDCIKMVERHIVMPAQATAYKIGMNKILSLRKKAKTELGKKFDIREFHDVVLSQGAVPLTILEEMIDDYIQQKNEKN